MALTWHAPKPVVQSIAAPKALHPNTMAGKMIATVARIDDFAATTLVYLQKYVGGSEGYHIWMRGQKISDLVERTLFYANMVAEVERHLHGQAVNVPALDDYTMYRTQPVSIRVFVTNAYYLGKGDGEHESDGGSSDLWPKLIDALEELNSGKYVEAVLTGGIGCGKTTIALYTTAYQLYLLSCMRSPHMLYGLDSSSEIVLIFQSVNAKAAKIVEYDRFKTMIKRSKYFTEQWPPEYRDGKMVFPNRIEVIPVTGSETAAIGQNVIGGILDELNYMAVIASSKSSVDKGSYDQAISLYNSISRRRKSRFLSQGTMPGILCLVSSKKYPGQFTDIKMRQAEIDPTIFVHDKRVWDMKPSDKFTGEWFFVFVGDMTRKPRVLADNEMMPEADRDLVMAIPREYYSDFTTGDLLNALREIAGVSTIGRSPYFLEVNKVYAAFNVGQSSIFNLDETDFVGSRLNFAGVEVYKPELPRFAHIDLGITGDAAGLAIGCVDDFMPMTNYGTSGFMPHIHVDGVLRIVPPKNAEILFYKIRQVIVLLRDKLGMNIKWVTLDSFQSTDTQQLLRQQGFITGTESVDVVPCRPYDFLKSAIYEGRLSMPVFPWLQKEILLLERDPKKGKVDHNAGGSKDCADALAGIVFGLTMRREIWGSFGIPLVMVPSSVTGGADKLESDSERRRDQTEDDTAHHQDIIRRRVHELTTRT
jgi:hypothetical protein